MKILCTICAREGSKNILNKNFKYLLGKPLISYSIEQAIKSKIFDKIVISSDSKIAKKLTKKYNLDYYIKRPKKFSNDKSGKIDAIKHAFLESEKFFKQKFDVVIDLDVTSPLRTVKDILNSLKIFKNNKSANLITVCEAKKNPYFNMIEIKKNRISISKQNTQYIRRQDAPRVYEMNASIYIWKRKTLLNKTKLINNKTSFYEMPIERSIDIDSNFDWKIVELLIK